MADKKKMNVVFIMTDTQAKHMVGCYGNPAVNTPNLDKLASEGIRFDRAYTAAPICTPARGAIFSGQAPQVNGAWTNNVSPHASVPLMGTIFEYYGFKTGYTGKWHLDGTGYFGDGVPGGGFRTDWWYDGKAYADDLGPEKFAAYRTAHSAKDLRDADFTLKDMWGHRVADRAVDFLENAGDEPFVLAVSFDEPHHPCVAPPEYWEDKENAAELVKRPNTGAQLDDNKPRMQHVQRSQQKAEDRYNPPLDGLMGCNTYIDTEIGRVIDKINELHGDNTLVIYTSDHGDMMGSHGLWYKGPQMYQETINIPFIVRMPGGPSGVVSQSLVSHLDIIPTMLDLAGIEQPDSLHGESLLPVIEAPDTQVHDYVMTNFHRFSVNFDVFGSFYPIRCATGARYKLSLNLLDTDELYDLENDPYEMTNLIDDPDHADARDQMHDWLLAEMERIRDPYRCYNWAQRTWRQVQDMSYMRLPFEFRNLPNGFPFQPECIHADGSKTNEGHGTGMLAELRH